MRAILFAVLLTSAASLAALAQAPGTVKANSRDALKYVWIPPGTFMMGCSPGDTECSDDEKPPHQLTITKGFWLGQTVVTVAAYKRFSTATGRPMPPEPSFGRRRLNPGWADDAMPIVVVRWGDAQTYCSWAGGRLPSEAEWEYAARAGNTTSRYGILDAIAWYANNSGVHRLERVGITHGDGVGYSERLDRGYNGLHDVGLKRANGFGLYDIMGNVWEWVNDWYDPSYYQNSPSKDPRGPTSGHDRVLRGGSWISDSKEVRVSRRESVNPAFRIEYIGVRCAQIEDVP